MCHYLRRLATEGAASEAIAVWVVPWPTNAARELPKQRQLLLRGLYQPVNANVYPECVPCTDDQGEEAVSRDSIKGGQRRGHDLHYFP